MSHIYELCHAMETQISASCLKVMRYLTIYLCMCETWLCHVWHDSFLFDMTHSCVTWLTRMWHDSLMTQLIHKTFINNVLSHDLCMCKIWLICMWHDSFVCGMTHLYVAWLIYMWHDSSKCDMTYFYVTRLMNDMTHVQKICKWCAVARYLCMCEIWLIRMWHDWLKCDMTHSCVTWMVRAWNDSWMTWLVHKKICK